MTEEAKAAGTPDESEEELKKIILTSGKGSDILAKEIMETLKAEININTSSGLYKYFKIASRVLLERFQSVSRALQ